MKERGKKKKLFSTKGGHRCAEQKPCVGFSTIHTCTHDCTHTHTIHTYAVLPLRFTQVQMLHGDLLDSPSHVNVQEPRERRREPKDGWGTISREGRIKKRHFHGNGKGGKDRELGRQWLWCRRMRKQGADTCGWSIKTKPTMSTNRESKQERIVARKPIELVRERLQMNKKRQKKR